MTAIHGWLIFGILGVTALLKLQFYAVLVFFNQENPGNICIMQFYPE